MLTDPIADMLTRIRNAVRVERPHVDVPVSKVKRGLADVLKREGYIWDWSEIVEVEPGQPVAAGTEVRPQRRTRDPADQARQHAGPAGLPQGQGLRPCSNGMGITIISTSSGVFSDREARQKNVGGEVLCEI